MLVKMETNSRPDIRLIGQTLSDDRIGDDIKIQSVRDLKKILRCSKSFYNIKLESLLENSVGLRVYKKTDKQFLLGYGLSLVDCIGREIVPDSKLLGEIENVLPEMEAIDGASTDALVEKLWRRLRDKRISCPEFMDKIVGFCKNHLEVIVLNWVEHPPSTLDNDFYVKVSSGSPKLFQAVTAILYQVLLKSNGNLKIASLLKTYVDSVMTECLNEEKDFLGLYPRSCGGLASLLIMPPEAFPEGSSSGKLVTRNSVVGLLSIAFVNDRDRTLMLLSHYPHWLNFLKIYLEENLS